MHAGALAHIARGSGDNTRDGSEKREERKPGEKGRYGKDLVAPGGALTRSVRSRGLRWGRSRSRLRFGEQSISHRSARVLTCSPRVPSVGPWPVGPPAASSGDRRRRRRW
eukprot:scaffold7400_cov100-Isochrysis_galbana.AAC.4